VTVLRTSVSAEMLTVRFSSKHYRQNINPEDME
jgi:hypothetical protein